MRIWHYALLPYLPDNQLKGQWKECALIADGIQNNGTPNHLLVNKVMEYPYNEFVTYCEMVKTEIYRRRFRTTLESEQRIGLFLRAYKKVEQPFKDWHNKEYLRVCMANLYEKHVFGVGKSRINDEEWHRLLDGYKKITGEDYVI